MKLAFVVGTRPNFVKIAPLIRACEKFDIEYVLVHTGQHYDHNMSGVFFTDLNIPKPVIILSSIQTIPELKEIEIKEKLKQIFIRLKVDVVVAIGDVKSTLVAAQSGRDCKLKVVHIEAGLRAFDQTLPEEKIRIEVDKISDILFVTESAALINLANEKLMVNNYLVGNVMADTLLNNLFRIKKRKPIYTNKNYCVSSLHRQSNVDTKKDLLECINLINYVANSHLPVIMSVHPRTENNLNKFKIKLSRNVIMSKPLGYLDFERLIYGSRFAITDSGGVEDETTILGKPCLTMRYKVERPVTVTVGTNVVVGRDKKLVDLNIKKIMNGKFKKGRLPKYWDGKAAERIVTILKKEYENNNL